MWNLLKLTAVNQSTHLPGHLPGWTPNHNDDLDDYVAHQTRAVSIKKRISMVRNFCRRALNKFTEVASSTVTGSLFHLFTTLSEKKWSLRSLSDRLFVSFDECPLVLVSVWSSKNANVQCNLVLVNLWRNAWTDVELFPIIPYPSHTWMTMLMNNTADEVQPYFCITGVR